MCFLFFACSNSVTSDDEASKAGSNEKTVTVCGEFSLSGAIPREVKNSLENGDGEKNAKNSSRTAIPILDIDAVTWEIVATDDSSPQKTVSTTAVTKNQTTEIYSFSLELTHGNWNITANAKKNNTILLSGTSQNVSVSPSSQTLTLDNIIVSPITGSGATGSVSLDVTVESGVQYANAVIKTQGTSQSENYLSFSDGNKTQTISFDNFSPGNYDLEISFYAGSDATTRKVFFVREIVVVVANMVTNTWSGKYKIFQNGKLKITDSILETQYREFFVKGSGGNIPVSVTASDSNSGSFSQPFLSLQRAFNVIKEQNDKDASKPYTIYIDGTLEGSNAFAFMSVTEAESPLYLTITSLLDTSDSRATLDVKGSGTGEQNKNYALDINSGVNATIKNLNITNSSNSGGGGIGITNANVTIENCIISGNKKNGGIYIYSDVQNGSTQILKDCTIFQNKNNQNKDSGVCVEPEEDSTAILKVSGSTKIGKSADGNTTDNNAIFLPSDVSVKVLDALNDAYINIEPYSASNNLTILQKAGTVSIDEAICQKFHLIDADNFNLKASDDGNSGTLEAKITQKVSSPTYSFSTPNLIQVQCETGSTIYFVKGHETSSSPVAEPTSQSLQYNSSTGITFGEIQQNANVDYRAGINKVRLIAISDDGTKLPSDVVDIDVCWLLFEKQNNQFIVPYQALEKNVTQTVEPPTSQTSLYAKTETGTDKVFDYFCEAIIGGTNTNQYTFGGTINKETVLNVVWKEKNDIATPTISISSNQMTITNNNFFGSYNIYYTTNGTDPREAGALLYYSPVNLTNENVSVIKACAMNTSSLKYSDLATCYVCTVDFNKNSFREIAQYSSMPTSQKLQISDDNKVTVSSPDVTPSIDGGNFEHWSITSDDSQGSFAFGSEYQLPSSVNKITLYAIWNVQTTNIGNLSNLGEEDLTNAVNNLNISEGGSYSFSGNINENVITKIMEKVRDASTGDSSDGQARTGVEILDFSNCTSSSIITLNDTNFLSGSAKVKELYFPNSEVVLDTAFHLNTITCLEKVVIPNVTSIPDSCFSNCTNLKYVSIGGNVSSFGNNSFQNCSQLGSFNIPNTCQSIGSEAFSGCASLTGEIVIPAVCTNIGTGAFSGCSGLTKLEIEAGTQTKTFGERAFQDCSGLTGELVIPSTCENIGSAAFQGCSGLSGVDIQVLSTSQGAFGQGSFNIWASPYVDQKIKVQYQTGDATSPDSNKPSNWHTNWHGLYDNNSINARIEYSN